MVASHCASPFLKQCGNFTFKCERRYGIVEKDGIFYATSAKESRCFLSVVLNYTWRDLSGEFLCK